VDVSLRRQLRVTFAGDGRERARLEAAGRTTFGPTAHAKAENLQNPENLQDRQAPDVSFCGWLSPSQTASLFETADLLVVPSIWPEPLGLIGLEAAAAGVPALAFDVGGIREWLEDNVTG